MDSHVLDVRLLVKHQGPRGSRLPGQPRLPVAGNAPDLLARDHHFRQQRVHHWYRGSTGRERKADTKRHVRKVDSSSDGEESAQPYSGVWACVLLFVVVIFTLQTPISPLRTPASPYRVCVNTISLSRDPDEIMEHAHKLRC